MSVRLTPEAEADLTEAFAWYRERGRSLGDEFLGAFEAIIESLETNPEMYPVVHRRIRRALTRRFPYCLFYVLDAAGPVVIACFHARRDPTRWHRRSGA